MSSELGEEILQAYSATTKIIAFENKLQYVLTKCGARLFTVLKTSDYAKRTQNLGGLSSLIYC